MRALVGPVLFLVCLPAPAQALAQPEESLPVSPARVLIPTGRIDFVGIPMFGSIGRTVCDAAGNMFFNVGRLPFQAQGPFLEVQSDGTRHVVFALPPEAGARGNIVWAVTPDGTFFVLFENLKEFKLVRFKEDGSVDTISSLQIPNGVDIRNLAIMNNGKLYVRGYKSTGQQDEGVGKGFAALLETSGRLVRDLSKEAPPVELKALATHPFDGDAIAGEDGYFYLLDSKEIVVMNQAGEIERRFNLHKPDPNAVAAQIDYSKGLISVVFQTELPEGGRAVEIEVRTVLLNSQTGDVVGNFIFDPSTTGSVLCFDARDGYSLMAMDGTMAAKDIVPIR